MLHPSLTPPQAAEAPKPLLTCDLVDGQMLTHYHEAHLLQLVRLRERLHPPNHDAVQRHVQRNALLDEPVVLQDLGSGGALADILRKVSNREK